MKKEKKVWHCADCGAQHVKWTGQCHTCRAWNTLQEEVSFSTVRFASQTLNSKKPISLRDVQPQSTPRMLSGIQEFDRLIGGGVVPGSLSLVGGEPGIGKSTLLLQMADALARQGLTVLYVCGEESIEQTSLRAKRLGTVNEKVLLLNETRFASIKAQIDDVAPDIVIVDSIQITYKDEIPSAPGSVTQVREVTSEMMHIAKGLQIAVFLIGHVTKSGEIAGPKVLEHLVDTVLYFEGDKQHNFRMIRVVKNRFGTTDEIAVFSMQSNGLIEVPNPSEIFLEERKKGISGSVIVPTIEGTRPILVEVQALVTETAFSTPSRRCAGIDPNRLALLVAVLEKRLGFPMHRCDVFVSIAGGLKILEPALDLSVLAAVASSLRNKPLDPETTVLGEVGLGGEVRSVPRIEARIKEALHMGFKRCIIPKYNLKGISSDYRKQMISLPVEMIDEAIGYLF
ncbi:MAG: DNA repair protein RadA [Chlamydiales bacterium]